MPANPKVGGLNTAEYQRENTNKQHHREHSLDVGETNKSKLSIQTGRPDTKAEYIVSRITNASKSPDKYKVGNSLVVSLNESLVNSTNN